jgi:hypothetical protein
MMCDAKVYLRAVLTTTNEYKKDIYRMIIHEYVRFRYEQIGGRA